MSELNGAGCLINMEAMSVGFVLSFTLATYARKYHFSAQAKGSSPLKHDSISHFGTNLLRHIPQIHKKA